MARQDCGAAHHETQIYHCAPSIIWVREPDQTRLIDSAKGISWTLQGVEAAIWDLLVLAYPCQRVVTFLSTLLNVPAEEAKSILLAVLARWRQEGIVEVSRETRDGEPGDQRRL
jgi:hypothetical protein